MLRTFFCVDGQRGGGLDAGKKAREGEGQRAKGAVRIKGRAKMKRGQEKPKHDEAYKRLLTHPLAVWLVPAALQPLPEVRALILAGL